MKKLCSLVILLLTGTILVGCSIMENAKRQEFEERFSRISEVYPTAKVEDLFKKFPNGFEIRHRFDGIENDLSVVHEILLEGNASTKKIEGAYIKTIYQKGEIPSAEEVARIPISYSDKDGIQAIDGQMLDSNVREEEFLFTKVSLDHNDFRGLDVKYITENPVSGRYSIGYQKVQNKMLNHYLRLPPDRKLNMELIGNPEFDRENKYFIGIVVKDARNIYHQYFSENVKEK